MPIVFAVISALIIIVIVYIFNKILSFRVCPVCAGVSMTWFIISLAVGLGWLPFLQYQLVIAILMGGTAVGIASQAEKKFPKFADKIFLFKTPIIFGGFLLAYWGVSRITLGSILIEALVLIFAAYVFFIRKSKINDSGTNENIEKLKKDMEECC
ncbi:hypothetical protein A2819_01370 [Candidatus Azambacteria bacterium RIFCSPHIGHO2_01_FULL_40_24]|uniref:Uncharacterized protein n=1 Tax=Candidatus Azambacteria bacterium RIFCSPHIGHO2_01_FULL_40_24 TaxID=1797301 RepID=A0A1F5B4M7_9BACT|nr:MAG: hypothetical protein A2819_01370 [Candidatus Azambacteria bacterium RIFCSPHIGHO2_01_FULL_40_24]